MARVGIGVVVLGQVGLRAGGTWALSELSWGSHEVEDILFCAKVDSPECPVRQGDGGWNKRLIKSEQQQLHTWETKSSCEHFMAKANYQEVWSSQFSHN